jgi:hypothetical protein
MDIQYTSVSHYGRRKVVKTLKYNCPSTLDVFKIVDEKYYENPPSETFLYPWPDLDWSLAMRNKIAGEKVNLSSSIAEYGDAARTFKSLCKALHNGYRALRKGQFNHLLKEYGTIKNIAAAHLMYDFGIKPLCHDLGAATAALMQAEKPIIRRFTVTKRDEQEFKLSSSVKGNMQLSKRAIVYVTFDDNWSSIEVGNPVEWAWELIPFSFVVDWAFPIGDWLGSLDAMNGVKSTIGTVTTKREYSHESTNENTETTTYLSQSGYDYKSHSRQVITDIPVPPFPGYEPSTAFRNVAQGLSLLTLIHGGR